MSYLRRGKRAEPLRSRADLIARLWACVNDPMWANHAEVPKSLLKEAAIELAADDNRNEYDARKAGGNPDAPLQDR